MGFSHVLAVARSTLGADYGGHVFWLKGSCLLLRKCYRYTYISTGYESPTLRPFEAIKEHSREANHCMFPAPSAPPFPQPRWHKTAYLSPAERWCRAVRVANRWRLRRRAAGILLCLCKANAGLHWHPVRNVASRATRTAAVALGRARARIVRGLKPRDSAPARVARALLEEEGVLETVTALVWRAAKLLVLLVRKWPWAHTVTAVAAYSAASRSQATGGGVPSVPLAGLLEYVPTFARIFTVTALTPK